MTDRKKYYALDDIGFVGTQQKKSAKAQKEEQRITGEIFRKARAEAAAARKIKKAS